MEEVTDLRRERPKGELIELVDPGERAQDDDRTFEHPQRSASQQRSAITSAQAAKM